jgi:hypothetical protein
MNWSGTGTWILIGSLLVFLVGAIAWAYEGTTIGGSFEMPTAGYVALAFGVVVSLIVGIGLMTLVFYSSRAGYDDPPQRELGDREREG